MTLENRDKVIKKLKTVFVNNNTWIFNWLADKLYNEQKMTRVDLMRIWNLSLDLNELDTSVLCILFDNLSKHYKIGKTEDYFNDVEINEAKNYELKTEKSLKFPLELKNVIKLSENYFLIPMHISFLNDMQKSKILTRDVSAQRETITKKVGDQYIEYLKVNKTSIKEIKEKLLSREYYPDQIFINLNDNGDSDYEYNEEEQRLTVYKGIHSLVEGNHRILAIEQAMSEDSTLDITFPVVYTTLPLKKAQDIIVQLEKKIPINYKKVDSLRNTNNNEIVRMIKVDNNLSEIFLNKIVETPKQVVNGYGVFIFSDFSKAIELEYSEEEIKRYKKETKDWIVEFLNDVGYILEKYLIDKNFKKATWIYKPVFIYILMKISKKLKGNPNWRTELENILNKLDFSIEKNPTDIYAKKAELAAEKLLTEIGVF